MTEHSNRINQLIEKLEMLSRQQDLLSKEIYALRNELYQLKTSEAKQDDLSLADQTTPPFRSGFTVIPEGQATAASPIHVQEAQASFPLQHARADKRPTAKSSLEKFIGENLINKIGIGITVIGVAIGARYSIEHDLISPLTRIILGYLAGVVLLAVGIKLKANYKSYSAVLVSGAMAIMYFITYAAFGFYSLFPQAIAFALMLVFTVFTVMAAINYNQQVIAQVGLVGAYSVPFLLSDGSGRVAILFSYMAIINAGILVVAIRKYWKSLYYSSFIITWLIYSVWYVMRYQPLTQFKLALAFAIVFFILFYLIFLGYKLIKRERFEMTDILLLLANAFIFYALGYSILQSQGMQIAGWFTLANAGIHLVASVLIYRQKESDRNLFFLISGLSLVFITISIPVALDGNWVTLLWAGEALLLFWIGRTRRVPVYEKLSCLLMILAFVSLLQDWTLSGFDGYATGIHKALPTPFLNINFLGSLLFIVSFTGLFFISRNKKYEPLPLAKGWYAMVTYLVTAILLFTVYFALRLEIARYLDQLNRDSVVTSPAKDSPQAVHYFSAVLPAWKAVWIINYTLAFFTALSFLNIKKLRDRPLAYVNLALNVVIIIVFLLQGLYALSELRDAYLSQAVGGPYRTGAWAIGVRYISFSLLALMLFTCYQYIRQPFLQNKFAQLFNIILHTAVLWMASSELINLMQISGSGQSYKLGLSILWGMYALLLTALGIWKTKQHLRVAAMVLFAVTLVKLFFYDISALSTIAKTIVFVSLGILLLIISFLYNKYKHIISDIKEQ